MATRKGTNQQKDDKTICMVQGCTRPVTHKNPAGKGKRRAGGYCSKHKHLAVPESRARELAGHDSFADWLKAREDREQ